jgi:predicted phosphodiesterase
MNAMDSSDTATGMADRVAALYDIHGNLPALEAVLEQVRHAAIDQIVVGGDVMPGPMPGEALRRLLEIDIPTHFLYGNGEIAVLESLAGRGPARVAEMYQPAIQWTAEQVQDYRDLIAAWPMTHDVRVRGVGHVLFCHATPRNENECFTQRTPEDRLLAIFDGLGAAVVVCGHTHMQFDRMIGNTRVVNAGSVGMPFGEPGADWLLLGPDVQLQHTPYDLPSAAERLRATTFPWPEDFAARYILQPPSAASMLDLFTRASI